VAEHGLPTRIYPSALWMRDLLRKLVMVRAALSRMSAWSPQWHPVILLSFRIPSLHHTAAQEWEHAI